MDKPIKFEARCLLCNTVATSYYYAAPIPRGKKGGMASCECGRLRVDAMALQGRGRIIGDGPHEILTVAEE